MMDKTLNCPYASQVLEREFIVAADRYLKLAEQGLKALMQAADKIKVDERLQAMLGLHHHLLFDSKECLDDERRECPVIKETEDWPYIQLKMDIYADLYPVIVLISGLPHLLNYYKKKCIPEKIIFDTLSDVNLWMNDYYVKTGRWGIKTFPWLIGHFSGRLYKLGRLQFMHQRFTGQIKVFRNRISGEVIALSKGDIRYRRDGQIDGTNDIFDKKGAWISKFSEGNELVEGNPILPTGCALQQLIRLPKSIWIEELSDGSDILGVHIPAGEKLSSQLCEQSFRQAMDFFPKYFPNLHFEGFGCISWLLGPPLRDILPPSSNIIQFQRRFYLYPYLADDSDTFERVFGQKTIDLNKAPRDTALQRAIVAYVEAGKHLRTGAGFILKPEIENWNNRWYEEQQWLNK